MKLPYLLIVLLILYACLLAICLISCKKVEVRELPSQEVSVKFGAVNGLKMHSCKWPLCPYKEITSDSYREAIIEYVGNDESTGYSLDMLHLLVPTAEYEELELMLKIFKP